MAALTFRRTRGGFRVEGDWPPETTLREGHLLHELKNVSTWRTADLIEFRVANGRAIYRVVESDSRGRLKCRLEYEDNG